MYRWINNISKGKENRLTTYLPHAFHKATIHRARSVQKNRRNCDNFKHRIEIVQKYAAPNIVPHTTKHVGGGVSEINALRDWNPSSALLYNRHGTIDSLASRFTNNFFEPFN